MRLFLGSVESFLPHQTRIYTDVDDKLVDLNPAYAAYLTQVQGKHSSAYDLAAYYFPPTITAFLERGGQAREALNEAVAFVRAGGLDDRRGPAGEKLVYDPKEVRLSPPLQNPEKSFVIGFSDKARIEPMPKAAIPTGFYKLPQTFVTSGAPVVLPKFSEEVDADSCLAIVIGKAGRRIAPEKAWEHVAGLTMLIDVTARDVNKREGLTTNNLLGKNFPSSTSLGPGVLLNHAREDIEALEIELSLDGDVKQKFSPRNCVFTVEEIIARYSILGVKPGDFLAIGTSMTLRGDRLENPAPLKIGSTMRCSSPPIGELVHRVVSAGETRR
jgi:2-keto-4-pentenoate hydratase/2-oxohepta-3-ene-1,7-dioic acid hydratase in catechol pathway